MIAATHLQRLLLLSHLLLQELRLNELCLHCLHLLHLRGDRSSGGSGD